MLTLKVYFNVAKFWLHGHSKIRRRPQMGIKNKGLEAKAMKGNKKNKNNI